MYEYLETKKKVVKTEELNELGKEGWEMITALRMSGYFQMIFKRDTKTGSTVLDTFDTPKNRGGRPKGSKNKVK